jgi:hypothetical protein
VHEQPRPPCLITHARAWRNTIPSQRDFRFFLGCARGPGLAGIVASLALIGAWMQVPRAVARDRCAIVRWLNFPHSRAIHAAVRGTAIPPPTPEPRTRGGIRLSERRGRNLNPRRTQKPETVFETAASGLLRGADRDHEEGDRRSPGASCKEAQPAERGRDELKPILTRAVTRVCQTSNATR